MKFVLAPKVSVILTAAILFGTLHAAAQDNVLAFNKVKSDYRTENGSPRAITAVNMQLNQQSKDALLFRLSVENPENEKLILYI